MDAVRLAYRSRIRSQYNKIEEVWDPSDRWHAWMRRAIEREMKWLATGFKIDSSGSSLVVDVGSGGEPYSLAGVRRIDVDIAESRLTRCKNGICANIENLPLKSKISDLTVCVGPVVNYCSLEEAVSELARVTKPGCRLVLHVELSNGSEYLGTNAYRADAAFVTTFYKGETTQWVYSDSYVRRVLSQNGLAIDRVRYFHMLSSFLLRLTRRPNFAARMAPLDFVLSRIPVVRGFADNAIFVCRRNS